MCIVPVLLKMLIYIIGFLLAGRFANATDAEGPQISFAATEAFIRDEILKLSALRSDSVSGVLAVARRGPKGYGLIRQGAIGSSAHDEAALQFRAGSYGVINLIKQLKGDFDVSVYSGHRIGEVGFPLVIKHMNDCLGKVHPDTIKHLDNEPMAREYVLTQSVSRSFHRLLPSMKWISPLVPLTLANKDDWGFVWGESVDDSDIYVNSCIAAGGAVRTVVEARVGMDVHSYVFGKFKNLDLTEKGMIEYLKMILKLGRENIGLLEALHATGVIHGDMHWGNIAFDQQMEDIDVSLKLIDLGMAATIWGPDEYLVTPSGLNVDLLAPWQFVTNAKRGFRDDVFRVLEIMAKWMSLNKLNPYISYSPTLNGIELGGRKFTMRYFGSVGSYECFGLANQAGVAKDITDNLGAILSELLTYIREIPQFDTPINYDYVFEMLQKADETLESHK